MDAERLSPDCNSYLKEIDYMEGIDSDVRREIDYKFFNSSVNSSYVFPRFPMNIKKSPTTVNLLRGRIFGNKSNEKNYNNLNLSLNKKLPSLYCIKLGRNTSNMLGKMNHRRVISDTQHLITKIKASPYFKTPLKFSKGRVLKNKSIALD